MRGSRRPWTLALAIVATVAGAGLGVAPAGAAPNTGKLTFSGGNDFTTAYFFRGILQERDGFITQPYGEVGVKLYEEEEGPVRGFTLFAGLWNSIHGKATLATGSGPTNWYEADAYAGGKLNLFGNTEAKFSYIAYTYPNGAFPTVQELDFSLGLNDSEWLGAFALNPSVLIASELENTALGPNRGWYMQFGLRPGGTLIDHETYPVSLAFPMTMGISLSDYYETTASNDDTFGFFQGGAVLSVPLAFIPEDYGAWSASAGASVYTFGPNLQAANKGDDPWVVGTWSIGFSY
jgi:hypothetical protein